MLIPPATDLAHHLRIVSELREVAASGYDPQNQRHHELLICLLMTAADLSDQTKVRHPKEVCRVNYMSYDKERSEVKKMEV